MAQRPRMIMKCRNIYENVRRSGMISTPNRGRTTLRSIRDSKDSRKQRHQQISSTSKDLTNRENCHEKITTGQCREGGGLFFRSTKACAASDRLGSSRNRLDMVPDLYDRGRSPRPTGAINPVRRRFKGSGEVARTDGGGTEERPGLTQAWGGQDRGGTQGSFSRHLLGSSRTRAIAGNAAPRQLCGSSVQQCSIRSEAQRVF